MGGQSQVKTGPKILEDSKIKSLVVSVANPSLCLLPVLKHCISGGGFFPEGNPVHFGDFSSFDWMDMELTVVTAPAGRSLRQLCSCSTTESCVV